MDRRRAAVGAICVKHTSNQVRRHQSPGLPSFLSYLEIICFQEQLDLKLQQRQARETGICPIREELYAQCFGMYARTIAVFSGSSGADELIRQITINCAERGDALSIELVRSF